MRVEPLTDAEVEVARLVSAAADAIMQRAQEDAARVAHEGTKRLIHLVTKRLGINQFSVTIEPILDPNTGSAVAVKIGEGHAK